MRESLELLDLSETFVKNSHFILCRVVLFWVMTHELRLSCWLLFRTPLTIVLNINNLYRSQLEKSDGISSKITFKTFSGSYVVNT